MATYHRPYSCSVLLSLTQALIVLVTSYFHKFCSIQLHQVSLLLTLECPAISIPASRSSANFELYFWLAWDNSSGELRDAPTRSLAAWFKSSAARLREVWAVWKLRFLVGNCNWDIDFEELGEMAYWEYPGDVQKTYGTFASYPCVNGRNQDLSFHARIISLMGRLWH